MQNIPTFAKKENPIKMAIINWLEDQYQTSGDPVFVFRMGSLEQGIRDSLGNPSLSQATIRTHTSNLISAKPRFIDEVELPLKLAENSIESNGEKVRKQKSTQKDRCFSLCLDQLARLQNIREKWIDTRPLVEPFQR